MSEDLQRVFFFTAILMEVKIMFENKIFHGRHVSIYIWSWINAGGKFDDIKWDYDSGLYKGKFVDWLRSLVVRGDHLTEEEIDYIIGYRHDAHSGRVEFENSAKEFLSKIEDL